jgi:coatomer subunit beta
MCCSFSCPLAAASCFIELAAKESDNNVKLIVLDRLETLRQKHEHVLDSLVMDILRVLSRFVPRTPLKSNAYFPCSPDLEVRRKAISISLAMVTSRNVEEVVIFLKKQLQRTMTEDYEKVCSL